MAKSRDIRATISLDDSRFNNSIRNINSSLKVINSSFGVSKSEMDKLGQTTQNVADLQQKYATKIDLLKQKQQAYTQAIEKEQQVLAKNKAERDKLIDSYTKQEQKIKTLTDTYGKNSTEVKKEEENLKKLSTQLQKVENDITNNKSKIDSYTTTINKSQTEMNKTQTELNNLGQSFSNNQTKVTNMEKAVNNMNFATAINSFNNLASQISNTFNRINTKIIGFGKQVLTTGMGFEKEMSNVKALSGATIDEMEKLEDQAKNLGATTVKKAQEVAEGYGFMAQAGWEANQMLESMPALVDLSIAGQVDMALATDILTGALRGFGENADQAGRLADIMAVASAKSNTSVELLGETFSYVTPVAGALGYSMEDVAIAIGIMANANVKGSMSGTSLRGGLVNLIKPSEEAKEVMEEYGIAVTNSDGSMRTLGEVITELRGKLGGLDEEQRTYALSALFGKNALSGWAAIVTATQEDVDNLTDAVYNSKGACEEMSEIMADNAAGGVDTLQSKFEAFQLKLYDTMYPIIVKVIDGLSDFLDKLNNLDDEQIDNLITMAKYSLILGGVFKVITTVTGAIGNSLVAFAGLKSIIGGLGAAGAVVSSVGTAGATATAGVTALGGALGSTALIAGGIGLAVAVGVAGVVLAVKEGRKDCIEEVDMWGEEVKSRSLRIVDEYGNISIGIDKETEKIGEVTKSRIAGILELHEEEFKIMTDFSMRKEAFTREDGERMVFLESQLRLELKEGYREMYEEELAMLKEKYEADVKLTEETFNRLDEIQNTYYQQAMEKIKEVNSLEYEKMYEFYTQVMNLTDEEAKQKLETQVKADELEIKEMEDKNNRIMELQTKAKEDRYGLTEAELKELNQLKREQTEDYVKITAESDEEAITALKRFHANKERLTAESMGEILRQGEEERVAKVKIIEDESAEIIALIEKRHANGLYETEEAYKRDIELAVNRRDSLIMIANNEKLELEAKCKEMNDNIFRTLDVNTGKILSKWDYWTRDYQEWTGDIKSRAQESNDQIRLLRGEIDSIPETTHKNIEFVVKRVVTAGGRLGGAYTLWNIYQEWTGGRSSFSLNTRSIQETDVKASIPETLGLQSAINELNRNINLMSTAINNNAETIKTIPTALGNIKDNLNIVNNNVVSLDKRVVTNVVDNGLAQNNKKNNIFKGKGRG